MKRTIYILYMLALMGGLCSCEEEPKRDPSLPNDISALMEKIASTAAMPVANEKTFLGLQFGITADQYKAHMDSMKIKCDSSSVYTLRMDICVLTSMSRINLAIHPSFNESPLYNGQLYQVKMVASFPDTSTEHSSMSLLLTQLAEPNYGKIFFQDRVFGNDRKYWFKGTQSVEMFGSENSGVLEFTDMVREHQQLQWEAAPGRLKK